jgi:hypothetical protein
MDLGFASGVLQMLINLHEGKVGVNGDGGNALQDVIHNEHDGLDWVLYEALNRVRRSKGLAMDGLKSKPQEAVAV